MRYRYRRLVSGCLLFVLLLLSRSAFSASVKTLQPLLEKSSWSQLEQVIADLSAAGDESSQNLLQHWLAGQLYIEKAHNRLVVAEKTPEKRYQLTAPLSGTPLGVVKKRALKKVRINNQLRSALRAALATWDLQSEDPEKRLAAVRNSLKSLTPQLVSVMRAMEDREVNPEVREAVSMALALNDFQVGDEVMQLSVLEQLSSSNNGYIRSVLASHSEGADSELTLAIDRALSTIDQRQAYYAAAENVFFGLSLGSVLLLSAIGLAITFGVMGVINMAHGEMMMLGAYTTFVIQSVFPGLVEQSLFIAIPLAFLVAGAVGVLIERLVIQHLYGRPLETLLATFGISLILQQAVRTLFSPLNKAVATPSWMSGSWVINEALSLTLNRVYIIGFSLAVFMALLFVMRYTRFGLNIRAVTQNRAMASSMGIRTGRMDALTFGLGSGIAGVAGVALSQLTNVGPNLGQNYIIDSFMVVVFGGVGNLWGTLVAAMGLGVVNKFLEPWAGAVVAKILVLVFIILFIQTRPRGLFALKGRAVEG